MIIPNPYIAVRKAAHPNEWINFDFENVQYHFYSNPVPGIYISHRKNGTYLYALKSNGKRDTDNLFKPSPSWTEEPTFNICTNIVEVIEADLSRPGTPLPTRTPAPFLTSLSSDSLSSKGSARTIRFDVGTKITTSHQHKHEKPDRGWKRFLPSILRGKPARTELTVHEFGGYKRLRKPLRVEYDKFLQRWMFYTEIQARTLVTRICVDQTCQSADLRMCYRTVPTELFLLDDAFSWVITATEKCGRMTKTSSMFRNTGCLLYVDKRTESLRRQIVNECCRNRVNLEEVKGRIICTEGDEDFVAVVRYLGKAEV